MATDESRLIDAAGPRAGDGVPVAGRDVDVERQRQGHDVPGRMFQSLKKKVSRFLRCVFRYKMS